MLQVSTVQIELFESLFQGRTDVFAIRWEKDGRSGYVPAYDIDWQKFEQHKLQGGSLKDFPHKQYSRLTRQRMINHLYGKEVIGIYPLLADNSSWFIVADFDESHSSKKSWAEECKVFIEKCDELKIPAYLERSRSGSGGHIWIFFESNFPAFKSRHIVQHILETTGIVSIFDKDSNYDRLFPNQDFHSGKGIGNLIALPFQRKAVENGNTVFVGTDTFQPAEDQWAFVKSIKKVSINTLDVIYERIVGKSQQHTSTEPETLKIILDNCIEISRPSLTPALVNYLRQALNFINSDFVIRKRMGKSTFGVERYFRMLEEKADSVLIPKGFIGKLLRHCIDEHIKYELIDKRNKLSEVSFTFKGTLHDYQQKSVDSARRKDFGIIVAPPGAGKTIIGLALIAEKKQPALILVHRRQLFDQWIERIKSFLGIAEAFIGKIGAGSTKQGTHLTVAMIQSLQDIDPRSSIFTSFGTIIIDECHHIPAKMFRNVIKNFHTYYQYGLTATPIRKNNDEKLLFIHIGDVIHEITRPSSPKEEKKLTIVIRETDFEIPFDHKTDTQELLYKILTHDNARNQLIVTDVKGEVDAGRKVLVLTERKDHVEILDQYLKNRAEVITITGNDGENLRKSKLNQINDGHFQVLIATGQFLGEGSDLQGIDTLFLAFPFSFEGKLIQYIGRIERGETNPRIFDYRDISIDYLERQFWQRNKYYQKLAKTGQLTKGITFTFIFEGRKVQIGSTGFAISIDALDLDIEVDRFKDEQAWTVQVINHKEDTGELFVEILSYNATPVLQEGTQTAFQFLHVEQIKFRSIDTAKLLNAVHLKPSSAIAMTGSPKIESKNESIRKVPQSPELVEKLFSKKMKVPFSNLTFGNGYVSFDMNIEELGAKVHFEIENANVRSEFGAVKEYFSKVLKKKLVDCNLEIKYTTTAIISRTATSDDIDKINSSLIEGVRFEFVKKRMFANGSGHQNALNIFTTDTFQTQEGSVLGKLYSSDQQLVDEILNIKSSKHYHHLKYLSSQHLSSVLKLRFMLDPFSFLFLLSGDRRYYIVWETLNSEEATYVWYFEKSMDALRKGLVEIEEILKQIKGTSKQEYLKKNHPNFTRIIHDYSDANRGFVLWKGLLEQTLV